MSQIAPPSSGSDSGARLQLEPATGKPGGKITLSEEVVATIAGLAARQVEGVHSLGRWRLLAFGDSPTRGVGAEVGQRQAALDLDIVLEYGVSVHEVASKLREKIAAEVDKMA
ncbi:MAG: Asp23/Gls24 family envelope stress response protein, partial [Pseudolabrys sp.]